MKRFPAVLFSFLFIGLLVAGCMAPIASMPPIPGPRGFNGTPGTGLMNQTINLTANMTAGAPGANGANGLDNMTMNMTINQTINLTPGAPGPDNDAWYLWINGTRAMTGNLDMGSKQITALITGTAGTTGANKTYVDSLTGNAWNTSYVLLTNGSYVQVNNGSYVLISNTSYAHLTAGKVPTTELGGAGADATKYLRGDQSWQVPAGGSDPTAVTTTLLVSDLYEAGLTTAIPGLTGLAISSGTSTVFATTANHPGAIQLKDSTTANGGYKYGCVGTQLIGGGETFEVVFQPVGYRSRQAAQVGWSDTAAANTYPVDGVYFNISGTGAAITLRGNTSSNSVRNGTATTYAPTTATWYRGTIAVNSAGTLVTYTIYNEAGVQQWTDTVVGATIPTGAGRDTSPCIIVAESSTDASANILVLDYVKWGSTKTLVR